MCRVDTVWWTRAIGADATNSFIHRHHVSGHTQRDAAGRLVPGMGAELVMRPVPVPVALGLAVLM